ncbi:MAG: hypothetical protein HOY79_23610 [Streptomyces sp.]|nr:hypothetical protein [Streptomyces sp.]
MERAAGDHKEHDRLVDLLDVGDWSASKECARIAVDTIPLLQRSDHPVLDWIFSRLASVRGDESDEALDELIVTARFRQATLVLHEGDARRANTLYADALAICDTDWPVRSDLLNNRGITWEDIGEHETARADFTAVIESPTAADESRACALNNRADIFDEEGDVSSAVRDSSTCPRGDHV